MVFRSGVGFFDTALGILVAVISSALLFGVVAVLENQDQIKQQLSAIQMQSKAVSEQLIGANVCKKCGKEYDHDFNSCPHCGFKE